jgi:hypothetical protein
MSVNYNPNIVTSGLVGYWDAGNTKSYPGSGTTWNDLSGQGYTGTLQSATYAAGPPASIAFSGSSQYVSTTTNVTTSTATFLLWIKSAANQGSYTGLLYSRSTNISGFSFQNSNLLSYTWNNNSTTYNFNSGLTVTNGVWCQVACCVDSAATNFYLNNTVGTTQTIASSSQTFNALYIGEDSFSPTTRAFNGNIGLAMFYNRALSAAEISKNFHAIRGRFGI